MFYFYLLILIILVLLLCPSKFRKKKHNIKQLWSCNLYPRCRAWSGSKLFAKWTKRWNKQVALTGAALLWIQIYGQHNVKNCLWVCDRVNLKIQFTRLLHYNMQQLSWIHTIYNINVNKCRKNTLPLNKIL